MTSAQAPSVKINFAEAAKLLRDQGLLVAASALTPKTTPLELTTDSRLASPKHIFLAYKGIGSDAHTYIATAEKAGVAAIICEDISFIDQSSKTPWLQVKNGRAAWSWLASLAFGHPQQHLKIIGVTGTNGKTSTVWYCRQLLAQFGEPCVTLGTLGIWVGEEFIPSSHTTPDPPLLFATFAAAVKQGIRIVAMECSSHAVAQKKLEPLRFDALAFTSFSQDHLDLHGTMAEYLQTKWKLFTQFSKTTTRMAFSSAITDELDFTKIKTTDLWVYGLNAEKQAAHWSISNFLQVTIEAMTARDSKFIFAANKNKLHGKAALPAEYATENLAAATLLVEKIVDKKVPEKYWAKITPPPGRMQVVDHQRGPIVIVDYAHTPDALEKTLQGAKDLCKKNLWVVFGCGGDRDRSKRPQMGKIASELADQIVITSDNPRTEEPIAILAEIKAGTTSKNVHVEVDRAAAIKHAITSAKEGDVIVIAGKGHENYQIIGKKTLPFDDNAVAMKILAETWR